MVPIYRPRSGQRLHYAKGALNLTQPGLLYLCEGQMNVALPHKPFKLNLKLNSGALLGLGLEGLPKLRYFAISDLDGVFWTLSEFERAVGQELELAIGALISLSGQQRQLNALLPTAAQETATPASVAEAQPVFQVSTESPNFGMQTQQGLFQLAFYGASGINMDILTRFGRLYKPGQTLCRQGEFGRELFLILEGRVEVSTSERVLGHLGKGDIVGEMAVLEGQIRSATVTAQSDVQVLVLERDHFQMIFQLHPSWTMQLLQGFLQRIADTWHLLC